MEFFRAVEIVHKAGQMLLEGFGKLHEISKSEDRNQRDTTYDSRSLVMICQGLQSLFPEDGLMGEGLVEVASDLAIEVDQEGISTGKTDIIWVIDPLCGTIPFSRGVADFGISLAAIKREPLEFLLGIVYDPVHDELFYAESGKGAFLNNRSIKVSEVATEERFKQQGMVSIEHKMLRESQYRDRLPHLLQKVGRMRSGGSCGLDLSHVACGKIDAVLKARQPLYDFAAGMVILKEAGGLATDFEGRPLRVEFSYRKATDFIASNGEIHQLILNEIQSHS